MKKDNFIVTDVEKKYPDIRRFSLNVKDISKNGLNEKIKENERISKMYQSPIEIIAGDVETQIQEYHDQLIFKAVSDVGITVDKDELIKALNYDRQQYLKGYHDAQKEINEQWIEKLIQVMESQKGN